MRKEDVLWLFQIFFLLFLVLYVSSYALIAKFRRKDREDYFSVDEDEATVYRISLWLCTVALTVSVGATLLLPVSIASNEVLILYPNSYYVKWLNSSLIQGTYMRVWVIHKNQTSPLFVSLIPQVFREVTVGEILFLDVQNNAMERSSSVKIVVTRLNLLKYVYSWYFLLIILYFSWTLFCIVFLLSKFLNIWKKE